MKERIAAALNAAQSIMADAFAIDGVNAVQVASRESYDPTLPSGPEVLVYTEHPDKVEAAISNGLLPRQLVTPFDVVPIRGVKSTVTLDADTLRERPMQPGTSFGSRRPGGDGTYGAMVQKNNKNAALTAGHVAGPVGADAFQPAPGDRAPDGTTNIGAVDSNPFRSGDLDAALVTIPDQNDINETPHYTPTPSATNPATGLYVGRDNAAQPDEKMRFVDMTTALAAVGASLPPDHLTEASVGDLVIGSGRTSGFIEAEVISVGQVKPGGGATGVKGFFARSISGGTSGDSGTVVVIRSGTLYTWDSLPTGETLVVGDADDSEEKWLDPTVLGPLLGKQPGSNQLEQDLNVTQDGLRDIADAVKNTLRRLLGDLKIQVHCLASPNPCSPSTAVTGKATACEVRISRPDGSVAVRPPKDPAPNPPDPIESDQKCCTFGLQPSVSVSGDESEEATVSLDLTATVSIKLHISARQVVSDAAFRRSGLCWAGRCDKERISGYVLAQRTQTVEIEATAGSLHLPGLGKIAAGKGAAKKETKTTVHKNFVLTCSAK